MIKQEKKNPFGSSISTYSPDMDELSTISKKEEKENNSKSLIYKGILLSIIIIILAIIANGFYVSDKKDAALSSIENVNKQMLNVQSVAIIDSTVNPYEEITKSNSADKEEKESAKFVVNAINYIRSNDIIILDEHKTDEETAKAIAPYAVLCDYTRKLDKDDELDKACEQLNDASNGMISDIKVFNNLIDSFNGTVSWTNNTPLPEPFK